MGLALLKREVSQCDVEVAWATYRGLLLAEVDNHRLLNDETHQLAIDRAKETFTRLYNDWSQS